ncbi:MAG: tetratricopeptide repeat protein [Bacteroidota bacterium]
MKANSDNSALLQLRKILAKTPEDRQIAIYLKFLRAITLEDPVAAISAATEASLLATVRYPNKAAAGFILRCLGEAYHKAGDIKRAIETLRRSYKTLENAADHCLADNGQKDHSKKQRNSGRTVHPLAKSTDDEYSRLRHESAEVAFLIANISEQCDKLPDAFGWYHKVIESCEMASTLFHAKALRNLGMLYITIDDYKPALEYLNRSLTILEILAETGEIGHTYSAIGSAYEKIGDIKSAFNSFSQSLDKFHAIKDQENEIRILIKLAAVQLQQGELKQATTLALRAKLICGASGDLRGEANTLITIGEIHEKRQEFDLALDCYRTANNLLRNEPIDAMLRLYIKFGRLHTIRKDRRAARLVFEQALQIARNIGNRRAEYEIHFSLSELFKVEQDPWNALYHYEQFSEMRHQIAGEEQQKEIARQRIRLDL